MNLHDYDIRYEALQEGAAVGAQQKAVEDAVNFLKEGDSPEKVARCIGIPLEEVKQLAEKIAKKQ